MIQQVLRVDFITSIDGISPRFAPMFNSSQMKQVQQETDELNARHRQECEAASMEFVEQTYSGFKSLSILNAEGWQLDNILQVFDDKGLGYQVAILSKY